uniref:EGF-like domain-containing protein n=1 Tax=Megaselia scalaris TaxID=36166 RepID=T1GUB6_MEGSC
IKYKLFLLIFATYSVFVNCENACPGHESLLVGPGVCVWRCKGELGHCGYNGTCSATGECQCEAGYQQTSNKLLCMPRCLVGCINSDKIRCSAKRYCDCGPTEKFYPYGNKCVPRDNFDLCKGFCKSGGLCDGDENGPFCQCKEGWKNTDASRTECEPDCSQQNNCGVNGYCYLPGMCSCKEGFKYDPTIAENDCVPIDTSTESTSTTEESTSTESSTT